MKTTFEHKFKLNDKVYGYIYPDMIIEGYITEIEYGQKLEEKTYLFYCVESSTDNISTLFQEQELFTNKEELIKHYKL